MTSTYEYLTVAELETYCVRDFESLNSTYTDAVVESWISQAERIVNQVVKATYTSDTVPDNVKSACLEIASRIAYNQLLRDGFVDRENMPQKEALLTDDIYLMLDSSDADFCCYGVAGDDSAL